MLRTPESSPQTTVSDLRRAKCPRCGYDQRGTMATWSGQCPMEGRCSECGLEYRWSELLHPEKYEPQWCVEFAAKKSRMFRACLTTFFMSFRPLHFWSRLRMSQDLRVRRLVTYVIFLLLSLAVMYACLQGLAAVTVRYQVQASLKNMQATLPQTIAMCKQQIQTLTAQSSDPNAFPQASAALAYFKQQLADAQAMQTKPPTVDVSYPAAVLEAVLHPLSPFPRGTISYARGKVPYVAPNQVWSLAFSTGFFSGAYYGGGALNHSAILLLVMTVHGVGLVLLFPFLFAFMPFSMRRAKVRWLHVVRAAAYGLFMIVVLTGIETLMLIRIAAIGAQQIDTMTLTTAIGLPPLMLVLWWGAAIWRYMKIRTGYVNALLLVILAELIGFTVIWQVTPWVLMTWELVR